MGLRVLCIALLALLVGSHAQTPCILITPSVLHVESEETIVIDAQQINNAFQATIEIKDYPLQKTIIATERVNINKDNEFLGKVKIKILSSRLKLDPKKNTYVNIVLTSPFCNLEKYVVVSFQSGYLFVQTDKTIYTPGSQVMIRIFPTNSMLIPVAKSVNVEILTPDNIPVFADSLRPGSFGIVVPKNYKIPQTINYGTWTISAKYEDSPLQNFTANFDVKEYVLPVFEVKIIPKKNFLYVDDLVYEVDISAMFLYGKPVYGAAYVLFGVKNEKEKRVIADSLRLVQIVEGCGKTSLKREDLVKVFKSPAVMTDYRLYVTATVITTTGTDIVEGELDDIHIVVSPYKIHFTQTSKYFKPGMPFDMAIVVSNPDGSPATNLPVVVEVQGEKPAPGKTDDEGIAKMILNSGTDKNQFSVTVKTNHPTLPTSRQATSSLTLTAYYSAKQNYLHTTVSVAGDRVNVNFNSNSNQLDFPHFTYLIINKGQIVLVERKERKSGQNLIVTSHDLTENFKPSFRLVAYYMVKIGDTHEIVSDSVWVKTTDKCMGTLKVEANSNSDRKVHTPGSTMYLKVTTDDKASVSFVAVDKGVSVLNSKHKITQRKIWNTVDKFDVGCTPGGGANSMEVFYDAGLALVTNIAMSTRERKDEFCQVPKLRKRRSSAELVQVKTTKASSYEGQDRKCCLDGMKDNPMGHSCEQRSHFIVEEKSCVVAFLDCCNYIKKKRETEKELNEGDALSRSDDTQDYYLDQEVIIRSDFKESFLWKTDLITDKGDNNLSSKKVAVGLPSSITSWEVLAVSFSEQKGICVSEPYDIFVMKDFFIDLRLPYSVVRNEQVEIRAVLYNYGNENIKVKVFLTYSTKFCSLSTSKKNHDKVVEIGPTSSNVASFVIIPLTLGLLEVEVKAFVYQKYFNDGVQKLLRVVPEGVRKVEMLKTVNLDPPKGRSQEEFIPALGPRNLVPDTEVLTLVTFQGTPISQMLEDAIDGSKLSHLIYQPEGCGEQNMVKMTKCVIVTRYLDTTGQWDQLGFERRKRAIEYIQQGYTTQLNYRKPDNSYAIFPRATSSTWLTAYVVKVFSMAYEVTSISKDMLCGAVQWLILNRQNPDGLFKDETSVSEPYLTGGLKGSSDPESALTAFVLVALLESKPICGGQLQETILMLQALSEYVKTFPTPEDMNLDVNFKLPGRTGSTTVRINNNNAMQARSEESQKNGEFSVVASGNGQATMMVTVVYYEISTEKEEECNAFELSATIKTDEDAKLPTGAEQALSLDICYRHKGEKPATMSILDISIMTGFIVDDTVLKRLLEPVDKYISAYEPNNALVSNKTNLIIYLTAVPNKESSCIRIRLFQMVKVGLVQPGSVTLYEYYNPAHRCTKFYHTEDDSKLLGKICTGQECRCAENNCVKQKNPTNKDTAYTRYDEACGVGVDYVYKATPEKITTQNGYNTYEMTISNVFKKGTDDAKSSDKRQFLSHAKCKDVLGLNIGKNYLVWGVSTDTWRTKNGTYSYIIGNETWVEWWPTDKECEDPDNEDHCQQYFELSENLDTFGCNT
uniref:Complement C3 n=1 Tax=Leptobrachium leishanense TaxID=445787 RepID=A0A8C5N1A2_9ANUR